MAFKLADLFVQITGNAAPLNATLSGLQTQLTGLAASSGSIGQRISGGILAPLLGVNSSLTFMATTMGLGLAAAATAGIGKAVVLASDLREATNKAEQAFGSYVGKILSGADQAARKLGIVKKVYLDTASAIGFKLEGVGIGNKQAADMSLDLVKLAIDMKSITNTPFEEVVTKMIAGINGEQEPVARWGVDMSEAHVKLKALTMGLSHGTKELDQHAKTLARCKILMEGLAYANGDAERTSKEFAWQLEILRGHIQNLTTEIGDNFVPVATHGLHTVNAALDMAADKTSILHRIWEGIKEAFAAPFGPALQGLQNMFSIADYFLGRVEEASTDTQASVDARIKASQAAMKADQAAGAAASSKSHSFRGSLVDYYNKVAEAAAGGKDALQKQQLAATQKLVDLTTRVVNNTAKGGNGAAAAIAG